MYIICVSQKTSFYEILSTVAMETIQNGRQKTNFQGHKDLRPFKVEKFCLHRNILECVLKSYTGFFWYFEIRIFCQFLRSVPLNFQEKMAKFQF